MTDEETLRVYAERADEYANAFRSDLGGASAAFADAFSKGDAVLDLGCGPGASASHFADAGMIVTAIDPVPEMVAIAARHAGVTAKVGTFDDVTETGVYNGIWANFSLLHAEREDLPKHFAAIAKALKPGGLFHIGMKTGEGMERDGIGRRYTYVTEDELKALMAQVGLTPTAQWHGTDKGLAGTEDPWVQIHATKDA